VILPQTGYFLSETVATFLYAIPMSVILSEQTRAPGAVDQWFEITRRGSSVRREVLGGITTFVTMAYIIVVNPAVLQFAGIPAGAVTVATVLSAIFGCLLMALYANRPIAVAPYMGENAFLAFGLAALGITWQQRLGAVFVSGLLFLVFTLLRLRQHLVNAISPSMKHALGAGIGLFLSFIGLYETGIITSSVAGQPARSLLAPDGLHLVAPPSPLKLGDLHNPRVLLAALGFVLICILLQRRVRGGILVGMAVTAIAGIALGHGEAPTALVAMPFAGHYSLAPVALKLDVAGVLRLSFLPVLLTLFLMSLLDTLGTLVGVAATAGMLDDRGNVRDIGKPMIVDAVSCVFSALVGTSTSGAYIESAAGIREGARSGLAPVVTALLFAASLFFLPLAEPLQRMSYVYGPALIAVGLLMLGQITQIDFEDLTEAVPAFATVAMMVFSYNIANGLTIGFVLLPLFKLAAGRWRELTPAAIVLALVCVAYFLLGLPH
jgi:AGZA family xanthine/uracil permease-like MFS transporter